MHVSWINPIRRNTGEDRDCPRISSHQPIDLFRRELSITPVARHAFIQHALRRQRNNQVVRTPDERHADAIWICLTSLQTLLNLFAIKRSELFLRARDDEIVKSKVTDVHERIVLVMTSLVFSHP
jgi:hypothetical protein